MDVIKQISNLLPLGGLLRLMMASKSVCVNAEKAQTSLTTTAEFPLKRATRFKNLETLSIREADIDKSIDQEQFPRLRHLIVAKDDDERSGHELYPFGFAFRWPELGSLHLNGSNWFRVDFSECRRGFQHLKVLFLGVDFSPSVYRGVADNELFPSLETLGVGRDTLSADQIVILERRPNIRIVCNSGKTLWMNAISATAGVWKHAVSQLIALRDRFPSQPSLDINATHFFNGCTPLGAAILTQSIEASKMVDALLSAGADPCQPIPDKATRSDFVLHPERPCSPFALGLRVFKASLEPSQQIPMLLWNRGAGESLKRLSVAEWIAKEPVHPLVAAFRSCLPPVLELLLHQWQDSWDWWGLIEAPHDWRRLPLVFCCLLEASRECAQYFYENIAPIGSAFWSELLDAACRPLRAGTETPMLQILVESCTYFAAFGPLLRARPEYLVFQDQDANVMAHKILTRFHEFPDVIGESLPPSTYLQSLERPDNNAACQAMRDMLLRDPTSTSLRLFVLRLQRHLLAESESPDALFSFISQHYRKLHLQIFEVIIRELSEEYLTSESIELISTRRVLLSDAQLTVLARDVAAQDGFASNIIAARFRILKSAGCSWIGSQDFVDVLWETWPPKRTLIVSEVFQMFGSRYLPSRNNVTLLEIVAGSPSAFTFQAVYELMQRQQADPEHRDDSWQAAFGQLFPVQKERIDAQWKEDSLTRLVLAQFISRADLGPYYQPIAIEMAIVNCLPASVIKEGLARVAEWKPSHRSQFADQIWGALLALRYDPKVEFFAIQIADQLAQANLRSEKVIDRIRQIRPPVYPSILRKFIAFHGIPASAFTAFLIAIPWSNANPSSRDPYSLLWKEMLKCFSKEFKADSTKIISRKEEFGHDAHAQIIILTLIKSGVFEDAVSLDQGLYDGHVWRTILRQSPNLRRLIDGSSDAAEPVPLPSCDPFKIHVSLQEALQDSAEEAQSFAKFDASLPTFGAPAASVFGSFASVKMDTSVSTNSVQLPSFASPTSNPTSAANPFGEPSHTVLATSNPFGTGSTHSPTATSSTQLTAGFTTPPNATSQSNPFATPAQTTAPSSSDPFGNSSSINSMAVPPVFGPAASTAPNPSGTASSSASFGAAPPSSASSPSSSNTFFK